MRESVFSCYMMRVGAIDYSDIECQCFYFAIVFFYNQDYIF